MAANNAIHNHKFNQFEHQLICGILYWGEGSKFGNRVEFTNSDPQMVKVFLKALEIGFGISRKNIKVNLHLHQFHNELTQKNFWAKTLDISETQFNKTFWKKNSEKIKRFDYPGCIRICYYSTEIVDKIKSFYKEATFQILGP